MKRMTRPTTAVAAALIVLIAAATMASGHTASPTTSASLVQTTLKKVTASGTYDPNNSECQQSGRAVSIQFYNAGPTLVDTKSATTGTGGVIPATQSANLTQGATYTATVTVTGALFGGYGEGHTCPNGVATSNAVSLP